MQRFIYFMLLAGFSTIEAFHPYTQHVQWDHTQLPQLSHGAMPPHSSKHYRNLSILYEGKSIEFTFPTPAERERVLANGDYNPNNPIPIDVDVFYTDRSKPPTIYITLPRFSRGVPYSVASLVDIGSSQGIKVQPYPSYDWHTDAEVNCNNIQSIYRMQIDACGQMWLLDSGEIGLKHICPPKLMVFDLRTDRLVHNYVLPADMYKPNISRFVTLLVDFVQAKPEQQRCQQAYVYMADATGNGIVVYDRQAQRSWRIENKFTYPDPSFGTLSIAGQSFELLDGVFGFAATPHGLGLQRLLYFHSLCSDVQMAVPLSVLHNASNWQNGVSSALDKFLVLGRRGVQCGPAAMSSKGFMLCGYLEPIAIYGWYISTAYTATNRMLLAENPETLQFVSGLKVRTSPKGREEVWVVSNRLQKAFTRTTNFEEINYRVQKCGFDELLNQHTCTP